MDGEQLSDLPEKQKESVHRLNQALASAFEAGFLGLTWYGGDGVENAWTDGGAVRTVAVVEALELSGLDRLAKEGLKLAKWGVTAPLIMTPAYIRASRDTFPLELLEIQQEGRLVFGRDFFVDLSFEDVHVRLQCERELKSALMGMRQGLLASAGDERALAAPIAAAVVVFRRIVRGMLKLNGIKHVRHGTTSAAELEKFTGKRLEGVRLAFESPSPHGRAAFERLYHDFEVLGEYANAW